MTTHSIPTWLKPGLCALLIAVVVLASAAVRVAAQEPRRAKSTSDGLEYVSGEILVKFKPGTDSRAAQHLLDGFGLQTMAVSRYDGLMRLQARPGEEEQVVADLLASGTVEVAGLNHIIPAALIPNDPDYSRQWNMDIIAAPNAWDLSTGSDQVIVGVVDSGLDTAHPEFAGRVQAARDEIEDDNIPQDTCYHGTHVAGITGARGNNGIGIAGLGWNVNIIPIRVLTANQNRCDGTEADIHDGILWALAHGARIINLSLGALPAMGTTCEQSFPVMSDAVQYAYQMGALVVAASGNQSAAGVACPARQVQAMAVGASTSADTRAAYSNYGADLDVVAPGDGIYSSIPDGYAVMSGTSMATPHVSGLAALIWSLSPGLSNDQVGDIIRFSADDLWLSGKDDYFGYGRINTWRALGLQVTPSQLIFLADDLRGPLPSTTLVAEVRTRQAGQITWTASISPSVPWLSLLPPHSGTLTAGTPAALTLVASRPGAYGAYHTRLVVTGLGPSGVKFGPGLSDVLLVYKQDLERLWVFPIFRQE